MLRACVRCAAINAAHRLGPTVPHTDVSAARHHHKLIVDRRRPEFAAPPSTDRHTEQRTARSLGLSSLLDLVGGGMV